jgi:transcriptional regulator with XRE-family HTH domain
VAGLRRDEVAQLADISIEYYTRLERGNSLSNRSKGTVGADHAATRGVRWSLSLR